MLTCPKMSLLIFQVTYRPSSLGLPALPGEYLVWIFVVWIFGGYLVDIWCLDIWWIFGVWIFGLPALPGESVFSQLPQPTCYWKQVRWCTPSRSGSGWDTSEGGSWPTVTPRCLKETISVESPARKDICRMGQI